MRFTNAYHVVLANNISSAYGVTENTPPSETLNLAYEVSYLSSDKGAHLTWYLDCILEVWPRRCSHVEKETPPSCPREVDYCC